MRLLLATPQPNLRLSLELLLSEQPGVEVVGAASEGDGLLALVQTTEPDLILTDWDLPGQSITHIVAAGHRLRPPAASLILIAENSLYQTAADAGADAIVLKGASPDLLLSAFRKLQRQYTGSQET